MTLTSFKLKTMLDQAFSEEAYQTSFNREEDSYRVEYKVSNKGVNIQLAKVLAKYEMRGQAAIDELVNHIKISLKQMHERHQLDDNLDQIYPVIRAESFPRKSREGTKLVSYAHTAETRILCAIDFGESYQLIDVNMLAESQLNKEKLLHQALDNLAKKKVSYNTDEVAGNTFYFVNTKDGFEASQVLNKAFLKTMHDQAEGALHLAIPHQDTLIIADVQNSQGYDILAQMAMQFFAEGRIPITALSFAYEDGELTPIFILAKKKPVNEQTEKDE